MVRSKGGQHNGYFKIKDVAAAWDEWESDCVLRVEWRPRSGVVLGRLAFDSAHLRVTFAVKADSDLNSTVGD